MGGVVDSAIVGRDAELALVARFLDDVHTGPVALVIEGEAGIGKTTVWLEAVRAAEARPIRVLQARPAESEAALSYAALADLVGAAFDETRAALPSVQERALAAALLRGEGDGAAHARTTATALIGVLTALAEREPLLVAIDDVQWLDPASREALEFAVRRLPARTGLLLARRSSGDDDLPLGLARALPTERVERVAPGPLSLAGLHQLVRSRLGDSLTRPTLGRLTEVSGGNPFFALEMAHALARQGDEQIVGDPLPVPRSVEDLVADRLDGLSHGARDLVLAAAALSRPTASVLERAVPRDCDVGSALIEAEEAGVLVVDRERIRFAHPLLASVVYGTSSQERRRQLHELLADVVEDPEERARHLASSATVPTDAVATEIESAAAGAARRGAQQAAAELYAASARLTPPEASAQLARRRLGEATALLAVGDMVAARAGADQAAQSDVPATRAQALLLLSEIQWVMGSFSAASENAQAALDATTDESELARIYPRLVYYHVAHDPAGAVGHADAALMAIDRERYPAAVASVAIDRFWAGLMLGEPPRLELFEQWRELEARAGDEGRKNVIPLIYFHSIDDFDEARARHAVEDDWYRVHGEEDWRAERQAHVAFAEFRAGRWDEAERLVEEACAVIARVEQPGPWTMAFRMRAVVDAGRGRVERARETLVPLIEQARVSGRTWWEALMLSGLAFVEYSAGDHAAVDRTLMRMRECQRANGQHEMLPDRSEPLHIESLVALDEPGRAREVLERLEDRGRVFPRLWITATLPRARALVLGAEGDVGAALTALDELDLEAASRLPFDLALTYLVRGRLHRRARQRGAAAEAFGRALELFAELGAPTWEERARSELDRVGLRRSTKELTATELRVAELAAQGLTNREVASRAFMSPKTVEANLARVYRKLGIRSRAELGARIRAEPASRAETGPSGATSSRTLATVLFTDLVGSTAQALTLGDTAWAALLGRHNETVRRELARFSGEEIDTAGDGFLALFDAPAQAIRCAFAIQKQLGGLGLAVRVGIHTGEVERQPGDKPRGIAIHACARIMSLAGGGEVLVSETAKDLVAGSGIRFEERGEHELRGLEGMRRVYAADGTSAQT